MLWWFKRPRDNEFITDFSSWRHGPLFLLPQNPRISFYLLSWVFVRIPRMAKGTLGRQMPTFQRTRHCTAAHPYRWKRSHKVTVRTSDVLLTVCWDDSSLTSARCSWPHSHGRRAAFFSSCGLTEREPEGLPVHPAGCPSLSPPPGSGRRTHIPPPQTLTEENVHEEKNYKKQLVGPLITLQVGLRPATMCKWLDVTI